MPLIKSKSQKAFSTNVEREMDAGKPKDQSLAIAYSVKRKAGAKKKMAEGGPVSAKTEKRPMPDQEANDAQEVSHNDSKKALVNSDWTQNPMIKRPKTQPLKHPSMAQSPVFKVKLRDHEDHLESELSPTSPKAQPEADYNEEQPDKSGPSVSALKMKRMAEGGDVKSNLSKQYEMKHANFSAAEHLEKSDDLKKGSASRKIHPDLSETRKKRADWHEQQASLKSPKYAEGGEINKEISMHDAEDDQVVYPAGLESDNDEMSPPEDEYMSNHFAQGGMAEGEIEEDHHASMTAAIMAKRAKMHDMIDSGAMDEDEAARMAEGGQVDIEMNAKEEPNSYYHQNEDAALKEKYDSDMTDVSQPMDSNEHGDSREMDAENKHDMISKIRMAMRRKQR